MKYVPIINEKGANEFEREQRRLYGRVWRKETKGRDVISYLRSLKKEGKVLLQFIGIREVCRKLLSLGTGRLYF